MKGMVFFLILGVVCIFAACSGDKTGDSGQVVLDISIQNEQGSSTTQALTRAPAPESITMVTISVTGLVEPVAIDVDVLESSFEVPAGKNREFVTRAFNSANELIYHGAVKADIIAGTETRVSVILVEVSEPIETSMNPATVTVQPVYTGATPINITSYSIRVTSPLSTLVTSQTYTPSSTIQVPSGEARLIELTAYSPTGDYSGTATQDFAAGEVTTVQVNMTMQNTAVTINLIGAPSNATLYTVTVTTSGETVLATQAFTPGAPIQIAAGTGRQFEIIAYSPTGDYSGSTTRDLTAGEPVTVAVTMQYADVTINPTLPQGTPTTSLGSYTVTITTSGSAAFTQTFTPGIAFQVPVGDAMNFEILVSTPSVTFRATTQNLAVDSSVAISPNMVLYETKIIIPDYLNRRIVQIDGMNAPVGWIEKDNKAISFGTTLSPYDIDFDSQGRIYIANNSEVGGQDVVIRINNINGGNLISFGSSGSTGYVAIAVDRISNLVYFASSSQLYRTDLDGNSLKIDFAMGSINTIRGMAIDDTGIIYIAGTTGGTASFPRIFRYDPNGNSGNGIVEDAYNSADLTTPWDVVYKSPNIIYVANYDNKAGNNKIIRLNTDFTSSVGLNSDPDDITDTFYGPRRFVATLNRKIYVIDDGRNSSGNPSFNNDRIVSIDDITGLNWTNYGSSGVNQDEFHFFGFFAQ